MSELKATPGPWAVFNMVHAETGKQMTPDEIGEYVKNDVLQGDLSRFLFVAQPGEGFDICHVGNGPAGPYNAHLIAAAPDLFAELEEAREVIQALIDEGYTGFVGQRECIDRVLSKARGEQ